jgi:hypothetical protein
MSVVLTLAVLGTWALIALGLCAIGVWFLNGLAGIEPAWRHVFYAVWTGFSLVVAGLMLWHFFLPVNETALIFFASTAALALVVERRWFALAARLPVSRFFAVTIAVFAIWTANHSLGNGGNDDYFYGYQTVRWLHDYRIVPGLANLDGLMGFNDSHHLFAAMLSAGFWSGAVNHIFNGLFVVLACAFLLAGVGDIAGGNKPQLGTSLFPALLLCPCAGLVLFGPLGSMISTLKADVFVAAATAVLACLFLSWTAMAPARQPALSATILALACAIATVKLSAAVFCGFIAAVVAFRSLRQIAAGAPGKRVIIGALAVAGVLGVSTPVRGAILSGYLFYPVDSLRFDADWRVPAAQTEAIRTYIKAYARYRITARQWDAYFARLAATGGTDATAVNPALNASSGSTWIRNWARGTAEEAKINIVLPLVLILVCVPLLLARRPDEHVNRLDGAPPEWAYGTLASASLAALAVWFLQAPAPRFVIVNVWILFASVFAWAIQRQGGGWNWRAAIIGLACAPTAAAFVLLYYLGISGRSRVSVLALLSFAAFWVVLFGVARKLRHPRFLALSCLLLALFQFCERSAAYVLSGHREEAKSMLWLNVSQLPHPAPPPLVSRKTRSGLEVYDAAWPPSVGPPPIMFETPLPNTRYFDPFLELRTGRMKDGFRVARPADRSVK